MRVLKTINNNVVSCIDDNGVELVAMGRGLGFRFRAGDELALADVEKIFRMETPEEIRKLKDLFSQLPPELLELCTQIIEYASQTLGHQLNESIYVTLADHVNFAIARVRMGMNLQNALATEVRVFYPGEYAVGKYALEVINQGFDVRLPESEAASIALHLINAEQDTSMNHTLRSLEVIHPVLEILCNWPDLHLDPSQVYYDELVVQLKFFIMQSFAGSFRSWGSREHIQLVRSLIPQECACSQAICDYLSAQNGNRIPESEMAFLAIGIHRARG